MEATKEPISVQRHDAELLDGGKPEQTSRLGLQLQRSCVCVRARAGVCVCVFSHCRAPGSRSWATSVATSCRVRCACRVAQRAHAAGPFPGVPCLVDSVVQPSFETARTSLAAIPEGAWTHYSLGACISRHMSEQTLLEPFGFPGCSIIVHTLTRRLLEVFNFRNCLPDLFLVIIVPRVFFFARSLYVY